MPYPTAPVSRPVGRDLKGRVRRNMMDNNEMYEKDMDVDFGSLLIYVSPNAIYSEYAIPGAVVGKLMNNANLPVVYTLIDSYLGKFLLDNDFIKVNDALSTGNYLIIVEAKRGAWSKQYSINVAVVSSGNQPPTEEKVLRSVI